MRMGKKHKKEKTEGLRINRTRQNNKTADRKVCQLTALRFQTGGEASEVSGLPSGGVLASTALCQHTTTYQVSSSTLLKSKHSAHYVLRLQQCKLCKSRQWQNFEELECN